MDEGSLKNVLKTKSKILMKTVRSMLEHGLSHMINSLNWLSGLKFRCEVHLDLMA